MTYAYLRTAALTHFSTNSSKVGPVWQANLKEAYCPSNLACHLSLCDTNARGSLITCRVIREANPKMAVAHDLGLYRRMLRGVIAG